MTDNIEEVMSKLDPKLRKRITFGSSIHVEKLTTPSHGLNLALRGGLAYGRQILIWGNKSAGKSSFCLQLIAQAQREGKICAWIDAEASFDPEWAKRLGVDVDTLLYSDAKTINQMVDDAVQLMRAGVKVLVVDSISALLPAIFFEKDSEELKQLENTKQIGAEARDMTQAVKMLGYVNEDTLLVLISQQRTNIGSMYASFQPTGGQATKFFSSTVVKLWSSDSDNNAIKGKTYVGDKIIDEKIGRKVSWHIDFNKTGPAFLSGEYDFYFDGPRIGVDSVADLFDLAEKMGKLEKSGNWYIIGTNKYNGRTNAVEAVRENPDLIKMLTEAVYG